MPDLMAIVSKSMFEGSGEIAELGERLWMSRYTSTNKCLKPLADGGRLFLVTVRPPEMLWLVAVLDQPKFDGIEWIADKSDLPITDITTLRSRLRFKTGKGVAPGGSLGASLQTPRALAVEDVALLDAAIGKATSATAGDGKLDDEQPAVRLRRPNDPENLAHHIELAKTARSACATCEKPIDKGAVRVAEVYMHGDIKNPIYRYHHLDCATTAVPMVVRNALATLDETASLVPDRAALTAQIEARLEASRVARRERFAARNAGQAAPDPTDGATAALLAQLADDLDDASVLEVLADELQARGDPRGELITVQLALLTAKSDVAAPLVQRRGELMLQLTPKLDTGDRPLWAIGFVRRLELVHKTATRLDEIAGLWSHPSFRLLRELRLEFYTAREGGPAVAGLVGFVPRSLRRLELGHNADHFLGEVSALVAVLPRLEHLILTGRADYAALAHPTLARLELVSDGSSEFSRIVLEPLVPTQLPAVTHLAIRGAYNSNDAVCQTLAESGWLHQLRTLDLVTGNLGPVGIEHLVSGLGSRRLARLDVTGNALPIKLRPKLAALCDELVFPIDHVVRDAVADALQVEHTGKPEWGVGKVTKRFDGKLEVTFPKAGIKVFRADAPFLKLS